MKKTNTWVHLRNRSMKRCFVAVLVYNSKNQLHRVWPSLTNYKITCLAGLCFFRTARMGLLIDSPFKVHAI